MAAATNEAVQGLAADVDNMRAELSKLRLLVEETQRNYRACRPAIEAVHRERAALSQLDPVALKKRFEAIETWQTETDRKTNKGHTNMYAAELGVRVEALETWRTEVDGILSNDDAPSDDDQLDSLQAALELLDTIDDKRLSVADRALLASAKCHLEAAIGGSTE